MFLSLFMSVQMGACMLLYKDMCLHGCAHEGTTLCGIYLVPPILGCTTRYFIFTLNSTIYYGWQVIPQGCTCFHLYPGPPVLRLQLQETILGFSMWDLGNQIQVLLAVNQELSWLKHVISFSLSPLSLCVKISLSSDKDNSTCITSPHNQF